MSEVSSRPRVASVACGIALPVAAGCALLAVGAIGALIGSLSKAGKKAYEASVKTQKTEEPGVIKPLKDITGEFSIRTAEWAGKLGAEHGLNQIEATKVGTLLALSDTSFIMEQANTETLQTAMNALATASDGHAAQSLQGEVVRALENGHHAAFEKSISLACADATTMAGFTSIKTEAGFGNMVRVIGTDEKGRSLVTEIRSDAKRDISITTEVLGVTDGSCTRIMDAFDHALEIKGIRSALPLRRHKGGVLDVALVKDFLRSKVTKDRAQNKGVEEERVGATRRTRKLNQRLNQHNRR